MKLYLKRMFFATLAIVSLSAYAQNSKAFTYSTPEAEGIDTKGIITFIDSVNQHKIVELHSFMLIRNGKIVAEGWWDPYKPDYRHVMHSVSKTFTSTAFGMAVDEGLVSVNDKVISFFPDKLPAEVSKNLAAMTIKDLLTMSVGHTSGSSFGKETTDWVKAFLAMPVEVEPGSKFLYDSYATYMVSAILQKVTGQTVYDYLTPRLFEPLGIKNIMWEKDPMGINVGGWGMHIKTEDMAKLGQLYLQKGKWNGKQLVSEAWIAEASSPQIYQEPGVAEPERGDWSLGYGYQIWRCKNNNYRADGAYGQFIIVMPDKDAVMIMTAGQNELELVWKTIWPAITDKALPASKQLNDKLKYVIESLKIKTPDGAIDSPNSKLLSGKSFELVDSLGQKHSMKFRFGSGKWSVSLDNHTPVSFGAGEWISGTTDFAGPYYASPRRNGDGIKAHKVAGSYCWKDQNTLQLIQRYTECTGYYDLSCNINGDDLTVTVKSNLYPEVVKYTGKIK